MRLHRRRDPGGALVRCSGAAVLTATVGPNATISLTDPNGVSLDGSTLPTGTYTVEVNDSAVGHNFHLYGTAILACDSPTPNCQTTVEGTGHETWTVTFQNGAAVYACDPHDGFMRGDFGVTGPPPPPPPPPSTSSTTSSTTAAAAAASAASTRSARDLVATVGANDSFGISLTKDGQAVTQLPAGTYTISVHDLSTIHNFHLTGPGSRQVDKRGIARGPDLGRDVHRRRLQLPVRRAPGRDARELRSWLRARPRRHPPAASATAASTSATTTGSRSLSRPEGRRPAARAGPSDDSPRPLLGRTRPVCPFDEGAPRTCRRAEPRAGARRPRGARVRLVVGR